MEDQLDVKLAVAVGEYLELLRQMLQGARYHLGEKNPVLADRQLWLAQQELPKIISALKGCAEPAKELSESSRESSYACISDAE